MRRMFCLWLVNQLDVLFLLCLFLGKFLGSVLDIKNIPTTIWIVAAIVGLIPAIITARFAKANFDEMISSGFIRWTSSIDLWKSEWKFFFKTLFFGWLFYGLIVVFIELIVGVWIGYF